MNLEVCIDSVESALAAELGGAIRVELCSDLLEGGTTPSAGLIASVRRHTGLQLFVMIRPRGGDFVYTDCEFQLMRLDIAHARELGADGVVFGILNAEGAVDVPRSRALVEAAAPLPVTFHRAIDMTPDPVAALGAVLATGASRILTSGGAPDAFEGRFEIARMVQAGQGRIAIMPGGGITPENIAEIALSTGAEDFHATARVDLPSPAGFRKQRVNMGGIPDREYQRFVADPDRVRALLNAATGASRSAAIASGRGSLV